MERAPACRSVYAKGQGRVPLRCSSRQKPSALPKGVVQCNGRVVRERRACTSACRRALCTSERGSAKRKSQFELPRYGVCDACRGAVCAAILRAMHPRVEVRPTGAFGCRERVPGRGPDREGGKQFWALINIISIIHGLIEKWGRNYTLLSSSQMTLRVTLNWGLACVQTASRRCLRRRLVRSVLFACVCCTTGKSVTSCEAICSTG